MWGSLLAHAQHAINFGDPQPMEYLAFNASLVAGD